MGHVASRNGRAKPLDHSVFSLNLVSLFAEAVGRRDAIPGSQFVCKRLDGIRALFVYRGKGVAVIGARLDEGEQRLCGCEWANLSVIDPYQVSSACGLGVTLSFKHHKNARAIEGFDEAIFPDTTRIFVASIGDAATYVRFG